MGAPQSHGDNENFMGQVGSKSQVTEVILSLDTNAYHSGDVLAATQEITNFFRVVGGTAIPFALEVLDEDKQAGAFDILLFDATINVGAENAAYDITDAEMRSKIGRFVITAADYTAWTNHSTVFLKNGDAGFKTGILQATAASRSLFIAAISYDTKTYSVAGLRIKIHSFVN